MSWSKYKPENSPLQSQLKNVVGKLNEAIKDQTQEMLKTAERLKNVVEKTRDKDTTGGRDSSSSN